MVSLYNRPLDVDKEQVLHITANHTGKMSGIHSISTSVLVNPYCIKRRENKESICAHCFAVSMMKRYKNMQEAFINNAKVVSERILDDVEIPIFSSVYGRFESFGDLINAIQAKNYIKIARLNPQTRFALWTKNINLLVEAFKEVEKPDNLQIIISSPFVNKPLNKEYIEKAFPFVDAIFTVYDKEYIEENNIAINCGARSCQRCGLCYNKKAQGLTMVNEILK